MRKRFLCEGRLLFSPLDDLEIGIDASEDLTRLANAETRRKPIEREIVGFAVIAPVFSLTKRNDVRWNCARTVVRCERYPVIGS